MKLGKMAALGVVLALVLGSTAWAITVEGSSWGTFSDPEGLYQPNINNGNPDSRLRWGKTIASTLTFYGCEDIDETSTDDDVCFIIGKLKFCNNLNKDDLCLFNEGEVDLTVSLQIDNPAAPDNPYEVEFDLGILELFLVLPDSVKVEFDDCQREFEFTVGECDYTLTIEGFVDECGDPKDCLLACECDCDSAWLKACLVCEEGEIPQQEPIPEPATILLLGSGLIPLVLRRRKARK